MPRTHYPSITKGADGLWHAWVTVGTKKNGRPDQRHVKRATKAQVETRVDELLDQRKDGVVVKAGRPVTVEQWLTTYLNVVLPSTDRCDPETIRGYWSKVRIWALPIIGSSRVDRLQPEQLEAVYLAMKRAGRASSSALKLHRILSRALEVALRRKLVPRNVARLIDAPSARAVEETALTQEDAAAVLAAARGRRNAARWSIALALGLRQGEALGLRWSHLDLEAGAMHVWWQLSRRTFDHGCGDTCGRYRAGECPARILPLRDGESVVLDLSKLDGTDRRTGLVLKEPKGKSKRTVPLPGELVAELRTHRDVQDLERMMAGPAWQAHDFVFARLDGQPIDPRVDYWDWRDLLNAAGVPAHRLHDARHTAGTVMAALGVPIQVVQELLGHSGLPVTRRYVHVASEMARDATERMGSAMLKRRGTP